MGFICGIFRCEVLLQTKSTFPHPFPYHIDYTDIIIETCKGNFKYDKSSNKLGLSCAKLRLA